MARTVSCATIKAGPGRRYATMKAGARPALAAIITSPPYLRAKHSVVWLRQELPMQMKTTRVLESGESQFGKKELMHAGIGRQLGVRQHGEIILRF